MADDERSVWTDKALDERVKAVDNVLTAVSAVPQSVAKLAVQTENLQNDVDNLGALMREAIKDGSDERRRLWQRLDQLRDDMADRDREYRRNIVIALAPLGLAALAIFAKLLGAPLPGPGA